MKYSLADIFIIWLLLLGGISTRFYRYHMPDSRGFDEKYFGKFVSYYIQKKFFFDIHPPFTKLEFFVHAFLGEYDGSINFSSSQIKFNSSDYIHLRLLPCIISSITPAVVFFTSRSLMIPTFPSLISGAFILFDTMNIAEGRLILTDTNLTFLVVLSIYFAEKAALTNSTFVFLFLSTPLSLAISTKFTSGGVLIYTIAIIFQKRINMKWFFQRLFLLLSYTFIILFILTCIHNSIFIYESEDIIFDSPELFGCLYNQNGIRNETRCEMQYSLPIRSLYTLFSMLFYESDQNINDQSSYPYQWPLCLNNWIHFSSDPNIKFYGFAQPLSWPITFILTILMTVFCIFNKSLDPLLIGYWCSYIPFFFIKRALYTYHYMIPAVFSAIISSKLVSKLPKFYSSFASVFISFLALSGFAIYRKYCYCL